eukprot:COSAG02_NODE_38598_length_427_cov_0.917683_1_plen_29_part_10
MIEIAMSDQEQTGHRVESDDQESPVTGWV